STFACSAAAGRRSEPWQFQTQPSRISCRWRVGACGRFQPAWAEGSHCDKVGTMLELLLHPGQVASEERSRQFGQRLREIDMFFQGIDRVHDTMRRVAGKLAAARIPYAIVGGMAVNAHRYERTTGDVDFLLTHEGLTSFRREFVGKDFE